MTIERDGAVLNQVRVLFGAGTSAGASDGRLLERFAARRDEDEGAESAFSALVERHGPMVLRTCRAVLRDEHDAQDAFQATFLVLARRAGSLWVRDSVGPWLHRVACRAAMRIRIDAERRRAGERRAAEAEGKPGDDPGRDELGRAVHEEVDRLPDRYRAPVVLCDLEGRTYADGAARLECPVGTVKSRLARGRERLRGRLTRRGLAPAAVARALDAAAGDPARAATPLALAEATIRAASLFAAADATAGPIGSAVAVVAERVLRSMLLAKTWKAAAVALLSAGLAMGGFSLRAVAVGRSGPGDEPPRAQAARSEPAQGDRAETLDWRRADRYVPPDSQRFFPDDPAGGERLDALWNAADKDERPDDEVLRAVRAGLRRTRQHRTIILRWIGNRFVWGKPDQNPDAIEIMYHAADFRGEQDDPFGTRHFAVYFGLSVVEPKTPAILRTLADLCVRVDDPNDLDRVAWGARSQRDELLTYLKPHLAAPDAAERAKAAVVEKIFRGELKAFAWTAEQTKKRARANFADRLPAIKKAIRAGGSEQRRDVLNLVAREGIASIMDDSFVAAFAACADDPDARVRRAVAQIVGGTWIWGAQARNADAVAIELRLARDPEYQVRYDALYYGLARIRGRKGEEIVRALLDFGLSHGFQDMSGMIAQGLEEDRDAAAKVLDEALRGGGPRRAKAARDAYRAMTGKNPPPPTEARGPVARYSGEFRDLYDFLATTYPNFALKGIDWGKAGEELLPLAERATTDDEFGLLVQRLVARLEDSHAVVRPGTARPPAPDLPRWDPGLACLIDDRGRPVVYDVDRGSPAEKAGVKPGLVVVSVDGVPAADSIDAWIRRTKAYIGYSSERMLRYDAARGIAQQSKQGARVALVLEAPDGRRSTVAVEASLGPRRLPRLPVPRSGIDESADVSRARLDGDIGYIGLRRIPNGLEAMLDRALKELRGIKGLILDLRGNTGGGFDASTAFGNFDPSPDAAGKDRPRFTGPIALLIDERTISAGEGWASWFVARRRARLFGTTSAGASCRKTTYTLADGLYQVVVPVKAYAGFLDRPIERRGLEPDVEARCTAADLSRGSDTVAEAASVWLRQAGLK